MALLHSPRIVTDGLVLCLDAANRESYPGSGTVWTDLAGSNNGTLVNGPTFSSANGGSIVFDGTNDFISTPINIDSVPNSLCSWFQPRITSGGVRSILTSDNGSYDKGFGINNGQWSINIGNNEVYIGSFSINIWYYGVVVYSATDIQFYINGLRIYSRGSSQGPTTGANLSIGNASFPNNGIGSRFFNGYISFCKIYNRALTSAEVLQNYNATKGRYNL